MRVKSISRLIRNNFTLDFTLSRARTEMLTWSVINWDHLNVNLFSSERHPKRLQPFILIL